MAKSSKARPGKPAARKPSAAKLKARTPSKKGPTSGGYDPSHPWYYVTGGKPLDPDEIGKDAVPFALGDEKATWEHLDGVRLSLKKNVERYRELVEHGSAALSAWTRMQDEHREGTDSPYREIHGALASAHNAILYDRKREAMLVKALAGKGRPVSLFAVEEPAPPKRGSRGRVTAGS